MGNQIRTTLLMALMTVFLIVIGNMLGGRQGMILALIFAGGMNFFSYWFSDKLVLKMYRAREVTPQEAPELHGMVQQLTRQANLPMPKVYMIPQEAPNAFATGRNPEHAAVAVTQGLLNLLSKEEVMGVLAHELAHVRNRDILIGTVAATMAGAIMVLANMAKWSAIFGGRDDEGGAGIFGLIVTAIIAPIAAMMIQMWISRTREYHADATGASIVGNPEGLASALEKLGMYSKQIPMAANPSTAHMFIASPLSGKNLTHLFSTHPPMEDRIAKLRGIQPSQDPGSSNRREGRNMASEGRAFWDRLSK